MSYIKPVVKDYGTLVEITRFQGFFGTEDSMNKAVPLHHVPAPDPSSPSGP